MGGRRGLIVAWLVLAALIGGAALWAAGTGQPLAPVASTALPTATVPIPPPVPAPEAVAPVPESPPAPPATEPPKAESPQPPPAAAVEAPKPPEPAKPEAKAAEPAKPSLPPEPPKPEPAKPEPAKPEPAKPEPPKPEPPKPEPPRPEATIPRTPAGPLNLTRADSRLLENGPDGPLPIVSGDGRKAWQYYALPFDAPGDRPRIAVVIAELGLNPITARTAIQDLPSAVTLAILPYASEANDWAGLARAAGHEVLLDVPMEPIDTQRNDPGPRALLTTRTAQENVKRLEWSLARTTGYVGITNHMGSRFTADEESLRPILLALRDRGLMFLDSRSAPRSLGPRIAAEIELPRAVNDRFIERDSGRAQIDRVLAEIEQIARQSGNAVVIGYPVPVLFERLQAWFGEFEAKGLALAPISALANRQAVR